MNLARQLTTRLVVIIAATTCLLPASRAPAAVTFDAAERLTGTPPTTTTPVTIACRFKRNGGTGFHRGFFGLVGTAGSDSDGLVVRHNTSAISEALIRQSAGGVGFTGPAVSDGVWTTIVATFDTDVSNDKHVTVYVDGVAGTAGTSSQAIGTINLVNVGRIGAGAAQGDGADYAVWNRVLTQSEIELYDSGMQPVGVHCDDLVFWWEARAHDEAPRIGPALTTTGTVATAAHPSTFYPSWFVVRN